MIDKPETNPVRAKILNTARKLFSEKGFDAVSIADLSRAAAVNRAMLYYYFDDKRSLYRAVIREAMDNLKALWEPGGGDEKDAVAWLGRYLSSFATVLSANRDIAKLIMREVSAGGAEREFIFAEYLGPNLRYVAAIVAAGQRQGRFAASPPILTAIAIVTGIIMPHIGMSLWDGVPQTHMQDIEGLDNYKGFYRDYILRALGAKAPEGKEAESHGA